MEKAPKIKATIAFFFINSETLFTAIVSFDIIQSEVQTASLNKSNVNRDI
jgi:hypothetical protein